MTLNHTDHILGSQLRESSKAELYEDGAATTDLNLKLLIMFLCWAEVMAFWLILQALKEQLAAVSNKLKEEVEPA